MAFTGQIIPNPLATRHRTGAFACEITMCEELFELVHVGDEVDLIADPTPEEASLFEESSQRPSTGEGRGSRCKNHRRAAMTFLSALGDFPEAVLGLAFSFGCALLLAIRLSAVFGGPDDTATV